MTVRGGDPWRRPKGLTIALSKENYLARAAIDEAAGYDSPGLSTEAELVFDCTRQ